jgi:alanyl-tRNA synthetase
MQNTRNFTDFSGIISNYETDIFRPLFEKLEQMSGKKYTSTLPEEGRSASGSELIAYARNPYLQIDIAFRVIADHIRTLSFAIADGIEPGNNDRNYVLRRILRRAVRYGRTLGFREPFFYKLVSVLAKEMGHVFPELRAKQDHIEEVIQREEEAFNKTLDRGLEFFEDYARQAASASHIAGGQRVFDGQWAFRLYDTYGFPYDLTELLARERGMVVDKKGFDVFMDMQRDQARRGQKKQVIELSEVETTTPTQFVGYDKLESPAKVLEVVGIKDKTAVILDTSPLYAEMGGQVGDTGKIAVGSDVPLKVTNTQKSGNTWLHFVDSQNDLVARIIRARSENEPVTVSVDRARRLAIQRHHTVTHLIHWALHEVVSKDASQKGSYVGPEKLTFDFSSAALTPQQVADVERLVNERILENAPVTYIERKYSDMKDNQGVMQFFGEKYGDVVRVIQIGGKPGALNGYSMELCGGTHVRATGEIGLFRIVAESAVAAGIRRIEAVAGLEAYKKATEELQLIKTLSAKVNSPVGELEKKVESLLAQQKDLEKQIKVMHQKQAVEIAHGLAAKAQTFGSTLAIIENLGAADGDFLQSVAEGLKGQFKGVVVLGGTANNAVAFVATVSPEFTKKIQAGKIIQAIAPIVGGKGGGRPDNARGGGKDVSNLDAALARAGEWLKQLKA